MTNYTLEQFVTAVQMSAAIKIDGRLAVPDIDVASLTVSVDGEFYVSPDTFVSCTRADSYRWRVVTDVPDWHIVQLLVPFDPSGLLSAKYRSA